MASIITHYKPGGKVTLTPLGYQGGTCYAATRPYVTAFKGESVTTDGETQDPQVLAIASQLQALPQQVAENEHERYS